MPGKLRFFFHKKSLTERSDEELMQLIAESKNGAAEEIYARYGHKMYYYFYRMLGHNTARAEDFTQDIFVRIIERAEQYQNGRKFSSWLYTIAANMCRNEYRRQSVHFTSELEEKHDNIAEPENFSALLDEKLFGSKLQLALDALENEQKMAFLLRYQENLSVKEISEIMACPEGTVKSRLFYTAKKLSVLLAAYNPVSS